MNTVISKFQKFNYEWSEMKNAAIYILNNILFIALNWNRRKFLLFPEIFIKILFYLCFQVSQEEDRQQVNNEPPKSSKPSTDSNGINRSQAIPILNLGTSSGESRDHTATFPSLPDVPEISPGPSPMTTTSSAALLLPDSSSSSLSSPRSPSRFFDKLFRGKQKKHKIPG